MSTCALSFCCGHFAWQYTPPRRHYSECEPDKWIIADYTRVCNWIMKWTAETTHDNSCGLPHDETKLFEGNPCIAPSQTFYIKHYTIRTKNTENTEVVSWRMLKNMLRNDFFVFLISKHSISCLHRMRDRSYSTCQNFPLKSMTNFCDVCLTLWFFGDIERKLVYLSDSKFKQDTCLKNLCFSYCQQQYLV